MISKDHINRLQADPDGLDFDGLRMQGLELLQSLSKEKWTDYNLHDPGVTLLELLCYGLTDLVYRTDFDVSDFLCGQDGGIDYKALALYTPQEIFVNQALTDLDFCKLIYDSLPEVEDVWILSANDDHPIPGMFSVFIKPHESLFLPSKKDTRQVQKTLRNDVIRLLSEHRNLCRDIDEIHIVTPQAYTLAGEIEIDDSRPRAEIYADIYFRCAKLITAGSQILRFEDAIHQGLRWEEILCGPLTTHGYINERDFSQENYDIDVMKLITLVRHIPGVKNVKSLFLVDENGTNLELVHIGHRDINCPALHFVEQSEKIHALRLVHGRTTSLDASHDDEKTVQKSTLQNKYETREFGEQIALYLKKYEFEHNAFRRNKGKIDHIIQLPQGQHRDFAQYSSLGENTPAIYGINHYGVPKSEPPEVHARARQLKAYLYPFEQMMANYFASLENIRSLYSIDKTLDRSYFSQFLTNAEIPDIKHLYTLKANESEVAKIIAGQDNVYDRRSRVLDSLLAIYGEEFPTEDLRRYNYYQDEKLEQDLINNKIHFLKHLCELSGRRGSAINVQKEWSVESLTPLQKRLQILTGSVNDKKVNSLTEALREKIKFISNSRYKDGRLKQVNAPNTIAYENTKALAKPADYVSDPAFALPGMEVCEYLLRAGVDWASFRSLSAGRTHAWLCLTVQTEEIWPLLLLPTEKISLYAQHMQHALIQLSMDCEGFHVVEHILLRPRGENTHRKISHDFYAHRVSIILPGFTARYADQKCRNWIENLIAQHLPAHIMPEFFWLEFAFLAQFELRYKNWMSALKTFALAGYKADAQELDNKAGDLIEFLKKNRHQQPRHFWI